MDVGFTGTRQGMTASQKGQFKVVVNWLQPKAFHHGGAVGADTEAAGCLPISVPFGEIPGIDVVEYTIDSRGPLARNRDIVAAVDILIAAPAENEEIVRSGTWATVRYARLAGKPVIMLSR